MSHFKLLTFTDPIKMVLSIKKHVEKHHFNLNASKITEFYSQRAKVSFKLVVPYRIGNYSEIGKWTIDNFDTWNQTVADAWQTASKTTRENANIIFIKELINCKIIKLSAFI